MQWHDGTPQDLRNWTKLAANTGLVVGKRFRRLASIRRIRVGCCGMRTVSSEPLASSVGEADAHVHVAEKWPKRKGANKKSSSDGRDLPNRACLSVQGAARNVRRKSHCSQLSNAAWTKPTCAAATNP